MSDKIGMIVSMVTPISLALVFNILCLTKNLYAIRRLQKVRTITNSGGKTSESPVFTLDRLVLHELCHLTGDRQCFLPHIVAFLSCGCDVMREMYAFVRLLHMYIFCIARHRYSLMLD